MEHESKSNTWHKWSSSKELRIKGGETGNPKMTWGCADCWNWQKYLEESWRLEKTCHSDFNEKPPVTTDGKNLE